MLFILDAFIVAMTVFYIVEHFFVQKPLVIFLKGLLSMTSVCACNYLYVTIYESDVGIPIKLLAFYAPVCFVIIICLKDYIFKNL